MFFFCKVMGYQSWRSKKNLDLLGSRLRFFAISLSKTLLFEQPGFESRAGQTLGTHNSVAGGPKWIIFAYFERSKLYLLKQDEKKRFAALLRYIMLSQSTHKSYHKWAINREWVGLTVYSWPQWNRNDRRFMIWNDVTLIVHKRI